MSVLTRTMVRLIDGHGRESCRRRCRLFAIVVSRHVAGSFLFFYDDGRRRMTRYTSSSPVLSRLASCFFFSVSCGARKSLARKDGD